jgi:hypothetical protein
MDKLNLDINVRKYSRQTLDTLVLKNLADDDIHMLISACFV